ncbi:DUF397 domain-containing protein [Salinactinospora qingdaonensis]|uniref:DUF397 domain-containing protein n=1 Tax=Salinactinospora qingdaonensis TaxID=702744 RepID=A0ABP7FUZ9_9ACTN
MDLHDAVWRKSSYSAPNSNNCIEVASRAGETDVRDSQNPELVHLSFNAQEWWAFITAVHHDQV